MHKVSIVILNWNGEAHLRRFLPSVVASAAGVAQVVVADNGSTDGSVELLRREFPSVEVIELDRNYGFAEGYNRALQTVEAEYVILLNSDVETPKGWIEPLVATLDAHPEVAACAPKLRSSEHREAFEYAGAAGGYIDYLGYPFCRGRLLRSIERDEGQYEDARSLFWVSGAAFCCRLSCYRQLGGFDGDFFAHMEEIDLSWRMQLAGWQVRIVPESVVYHYGGGTLQTDSPRKIFLNHRNNLAMLLKCASTGQLIVALLLRPSLDQLAALTYLLQGHVANFWAVYRAWASFLGRLGSLCRKRRAVQRLGDASQHIYRGSLLWRYLWGCRTFSQLIRK
ncbi:MAG: glycosyltransferase family 2 protein [Alistipes sp.]|nr:glycosyltransferase family 2 protein [Alistipes sp.]